ncbi:MAG: GAF domain-containing protein [Oscillochloris sp.]|nr:GAF domain-containing protein [Oscillochloris sp.]
MNHSPANPAAAEIIELRRQIDEAQRRAESLRRVIELISGELELGTLLTRIIESAVEITGGEYGSIGLVVEHRDGPRTRTAAVVNLPSITIDSELAIDQGMMGHILRVQRPVRVDRYADLPQMTIPGLAENAVVGIPIWWSRRLIGVLSIGARPPARFSAEDEETLIALARHAAVAVENARLFKAERRRTERIALINRVARLITSSLSFEELFQAAVDTIRANFGFSYLGAGIIDPDDPEWLLLLAQSGQEPFLIPAGYRHPRNEGILGATLRAGRTLLINDVRNDPRYLALLGDPAVVAELVVPIIVGNRVIGLINIEAHHPIDQDEVESIETLADQFGAALKNARLFGETQRALEATRLLFDVSQRLGTAMSVVDVVRAYLEEVAARGRYVCTVALYELQASGQRKNVVVQGVWSHEHGLLMEQVRVPYTRDALDEPLDAGETVTIQNVHSDPRCSAALREVQTADGRPALALIPLLASGRRIGLVILSYVRPHDWPPAELRIYQTTAAQLANALDSRIQHSLLAERSRLVAIFEERRRLARELHDSVTQSLFSISLLAQVLPDLWKIDQAETTRSLEQVRDLTRGALAEMRELLYELRPEDSDEQDVAQALRARSGAFERRTGVRVHVAAPKSLRLPTELAQALVRICQEALTNIDHHARADRVNLELQVGPPLSLIISDNGRGFDPSTLVNGRLGLISMRERAQAIGASLQIASAPGKARQCG